MKKYLFWSLCLLVVIATTGCGGGKKSESKPSNPYDGIYEWQVVFSNLIGERYKEELGCEIVNGKVVKATWYGSGRMSSNATMTGSLTGSTLKLSGTNPYSFTMECEIDLRTNRGTISISPLISTTNVRYERLN